MADAEEDARRSREEAAWREIVDNFGERADLPPAEAPTAGLAFGPAEGEPVLATGAPALEPGEQAAADGPEDPDEHFVPPDPGPMALPPTPRLIAWTGLFGVPLVALAMLMIGFWPPSPIGLLMLVWFVGGFGYLVATMSNGDPDGGWDDGAVL